GALRTLADAPGVIDTAAVRRATAKIERAVGDAAVAVDFAVPGTGRRQDEDRATTAVREALAGGRAMRILYYTAGRDAVSRRTIDPMRLLLAEGRGYLEAWCRRAEGVRLFRLDRVEDVEVLDEPSEPPSTAEPTDLSGGVFHPGDEHRSAVLELEPEALWVAEYYPVDEVVTEPAGDGGGRPGRARVVLRYADPAWLVRMVLGLGGSARIVDPPELAAAVAERAHVALGRIAAGKAET
ncbi:MAG: WYL domain-containing protein, partial [Pseudonocardia sp.]|nr:WYL domain-containing protein [Pseudonocardia sp.]